MEILVVRIFLPTGMLCTNWVWNEAPFICSAVYGFVLKSHLALVSLSRTRKIRSAPMLMATTPTSPESPFSSSPCSPMQLSPSHKVPSPHFSPLPGYRLINMPLKSAPYKSLTICNSSSMGASITVVLATWLEKAYPLILGELAKNPTSRL